LPHNVVGIFNQTTAQDAVNSTGLIVDNSTNSTNNNNNAQPSPQSSSGAVAVDSGFIQQGQSWQYSFNETGVFNYLCTIHAEEGMRGTLIIATASAS
jgi:plastocyanin